MKWKPVTKARYWEMLEILPPAVHRSSGFLVGEPWRHDAHGRPMFAPFVMVNGQHYEGAEPLTVRQFDALTLAEILDNVATVEA